MAMRRILANQAKLLQAQAKQTNRHFHYDTCGRAIMGNPNVQKTPTDFFNYHYVPNNYPDSLSGFRIAYRDNFEVQAVFAYENWEYKYDGQWWHIGSFFSNVLFFLTPAFIYLILAVENLSQEKIGAPTNKFYHNYGGFIQMHYVNSDEKPIVEKW